MSSSLLFATVIISTIILHTQSIHVMKDDSGHIDMAVELDIGADTTTLYMRSFTPNVWFGIAINQDAHSSTTPTMAVIYNANGDGKLHDAVVADNYSIPTLIPSQWTLTNKITIGSTTSIILTRPNVIASDSRYPDFNVCDAFYDLNTMWAHGTSSTFTDHGAANRIVATLRRQTPYTTPSPVPSIQPDLSYTSLPTTNCPISSTCTTFNDNKACCQQNINCQWKDTITCNYEQGADICCLDIVSVDPGITTTTTIKPTANPTSNPTNNPTQRPTAQPTPNPTCPRDPNDSLDDDPCTGYTTDCCKSFDECAWSVREASCYTITTMKPTLEPTNKPTDGPTIEPTPSPTCPQFPQDSDEGDGCSGFSRKCCMNSMDCRWSESVFCSEEGGQTEGGAECCYAITTTEEPTGSPTGSPTTTTTTLQPTPSPVCDDSYDESGDGCSGHSRKCCPMAICGWRDSDFCAANDDGPNCCYPLTATPTLSPITPQPVVTPTTEPPTTAEPTLDPTVKPSKSPTNKPTEYPTSAPSISPTLRPTDAEEEEEEDELEYVEPCECDEGVISMTLRYNGKRTAKKVIIYYENENQEKKTICKYQYVSYGQELVCDVTKSKNAQNMGYQFTDITYFAIKYQTYDDSNDSSRRRLGGRAYGGSDSHEEAAEVKEFCAGSIDTTCRQDIVGDISTECDDLMVIAWTDKEDEECDERSTRNIYPGMVEYDAFMDDDKKSTDILAKGLMIAAGLFSIVVILCMVKCLKKMDQHFFRANSTRHAFEGMSMMGEAQERERKSTEQMTETIDEGNHIIETEEMVIEMPSFELK